MQRAERPVFIGKPTDGNRLTTDWVRLPSKPIHGGGPRASAAATQPAQPAERPRCPLPASPPAHSSSFAKRRAV